MKGLSISGIFSLRQINFTALYYNIMMKINILGKENVGTFMYSCNPGDVCK